MTINDRCPEALEYELFDFYGGVRKPELPTLLLRLRCASVGGIDRLSHKGHISHTR